MALATTNHMQPTLTITKDPEIGYRLQASMKVELSRWQVFEFFADARELERITPPWLNFTVLTPAPIELCEGALIDYRLRLHGIPIKWRTEISEWNPPFSFTDQQLRGPYKKWFHQHRFEEVEGGTLVLDDVHYIPTGGSLIHKWLVRPDLEKIFKYRQDTLKSIFDEMIRSKS